MRWASHPRPCRPWLYLGPLRYLLVLSFIFFATLLPRPAAGVIVVKLPSEREVTLQMWDFFGDLKANDYQFHGVMHKVVIHRHCKVVLPSQPFNRTSHPELSSRDLEGTILFIFFRATKYLGCRTFTDILKQLDGYTKALTDLSYPKPQLAIFNCRHSYPEDFGSPDIDPPDNYFKFRPKDLALGLIGSKAGKGLNDLFSRRSLILVDAEHDPGPYNSIFLSINWTLLKSATYAAHSALAAYGIFQLYIIYQTQGLRLNLRVFIILISLFYLVVNGILQYGDLQSNAGYVIIYVSWAIGSFAYNLVVVLWLRAAKKVEPGRFYELMYCLAMLNVLGWCFVSGVSVMSMFFYYVDEVKSVVGYRPAIQGFLSSAEGLLLLYYGICMIYRNRGLVSGSHHNRFNALRRMTTLCFMAFVGYVLQAVSCILLTDDREESANGYVVRYLCYRASTLILYGSLLWTLRVDGSLSDMRNHGRSTTRGLATDSGDGYNDDEVLNDHADLHKRQHRTLARHFSIELPPPSTPARHTARNSFDLSSQRDTLRSTMNSRPDSPVVQPPPPPSLIFPSRTLAAAPVLHLPTIPTPDLAAYERWIARFRGPMESNPPSSSATFSSSFNTSPLHAPDPSSSLSPSSLTQALIAKNATATAEPDRATLAACTTASSRHDVTANTWPNSPRHGPVLLPVGHGLVIGPLDLANDVSEEPRRHRLST